MAWKPKLPRPEHQDPAHITKEMISKLSCKSEYKKRQHTPDDEIYLKPMRFSCPFCIGRGRKPIISNLWKLHIHFKFHHQNDFECKEVTQNLEKLIRLGVLRI